METNSDKVDGIQAKPLELLKAWHLATLRKERDDETSLTPAGLINSDRRRIEALLDSATVSSLPSAKPSSLAPYVWTFAFLILAGTALQISSFFATGSSPDMLAMLHVGTLVILAAAFILGYIFHGQVILPMLDARNALLPWAPPHSQVNFASIPSIIDRLLEENQQHQVGEQLMFDSTGPLLLCLNDQSIIRAINGRSTSELGKLPALLLGQPIIDLVLEEDRNSVSQALESAKNDSTEKALEARFQTASAEIVDMELRIQWSMQSRYFFLSARNITDTKMLERARREYVSTLAHDIRTPLSSAWTSLGTLQNNTYLSTKQSATIRRAEVGVERVLALLEELLAYERSVEIGRYPITTSAISTLELVGAAQDILEPLAESKGSPLVVDVEDVVIHADFKKLLRVLENLISNALKYTPSASPVKIDGKLIDNNYEFTVTDQGVGVPREYMHTIFKRYQRAPATEEESGVGLGLSICKAIVEAHDGTIGVESDSKSYSKFWIRLPVSKTD